MRSEPQPMGIPLDRLEPDRRRALRLVRLDVAFRMLEDAERALPTEDLVVLLEEHDSANFFCGPLTRAAAMQTIQSAALAELPAADEFTLIIVALGTRQIGPWRRPRPRLRSVAWS